MAYNFSTEKNFSTTNGIYGRLNYAEWNGASWDIAPVDYSSLSDVGKNCSLAWTPDGRPGILYLNLTPPQYLKYAVRDAAGNWQTFPIVPIHPSYQYLHHMTSLAYDQAGFYGMAYWDKDTRGETPMFLGSHAGLAPEIVDEVALNPAYDASIKVHFTSSGLPAVVYCDVSNAAVVYALRLVPPT
jgi:hypothetical protein